MVELNPIEQLIVNAMKELGATKEQGLKTADDITKKTNRPKSMVTNSLIMLANKGVVKRVVREKASGYYLVQQSA
ncbi:MAG: transcriptional regulator [Candidatus Marsarchaeota archaeon]|nr:transcriptional regulator [Candidatus Marsarchaeota archaeon]